MADKNALIDDLKHNVVEVMFTKKDGSVRVMKCTLDKQYLPPEPPEPKAYDGWKDMSTEQIVNKCKDNPSLWADAFCAFFSEPNYGVMLGWFTNAIETACEHRKRKEQSDLVTVFELGVGWRSFDINRLMSAQIVTG